MEITIKQRIVEKLRSDVAAFTKLEKVWDDDGSSKYSDTDLDLGTLTRSECEKLHDILKTSGIQGTRVLAADIAKYLKAGEQGIETMTARTVRQAAWMLEYYVAKMKHHIIFSRDDYEGGSYVGYYIEDIDYVARYERSGDVIPEHVKVTLYYIDRDMRRVLEHDWFAETVLDKKAEDIFECEQYLVETPELMARLKRETELFYEIREHVGKKYVARGLAAADLDDEIRGHEDSRGRKYVAKVRLSPFDIETPAVIDVMSEDDKKDRYSHKHDVNIYRWHPWNMRFHSPSEDALARHLEADEDTDFQPHLQLPVHPLVPIFDLKRHQRCRAHVNNLREYVYRTDVADGLVIPKRDRDLIDLLVDQSTNSFQDVVENKGQSMNVLSAGPPGTGKTLTAEVFAEFKQRPLYTVQCSQLGLTPDDVENNLMVVLKRANRWNAILLLDEADVYIRRRGEDFMHNAIVGVFLRVLEYAQCILFMTTNLGEMVDDAIASRCIVKIDYHVPTPEDQKAIWRKLADLNGIKIAPAVISQFVAKHPHISGRDVKNLLKLASFVSARSGKPVTEDTLEFALIYKPTASIEVES